MSIRLSQRRWRISSGDLVADVDLAHGGKIRALRSRRSGRNFLFHDPRRNPRGEKYLEHDISGWDECFPTVGASAAPQALDHGVLWRTPWHGQRFERQLVTKVVKPNGMPVMLTRIITPMESNRLLFDYTFLNLSREPLPFIYSSHPILAVDPDSRIRLSHIRQLLVLGQNGRLKSGRRQPWPVATETDGTTVRLDTHFTPDRQLAGKWFAKTPGPALVTFPRTGEALRWTWDAEKLPYLGIWLSLGIPLDERHPDPEQWICAALEPCTSKRDLLEPEHSLQLLPGEPYSFWIQVELLSPRRQARRLRRWLGGKWLPLKRRP
ncbi:MAG: hypothetical protein AB1439_06415 [candidate division FCPU426 bacterium]